MDLFCFTESYKAIFGKEFNHIDYYILLNDALMHVYAGSDAYSALWSVLDYF